MISSNLFPGWADAGQRVGSNRHEPYLPVGFWNGYLIGGNTCQVSPTGCQAFGHLGTAHNSPHCLATEPFPAATPGPNHMPSVIDKAAPVRGGAQREVRLLQLMIQAIDHQRDGKAMAVDIYHWLEQYDPIRFSRQNSRLWRNQVRGYLSNRRDLFVKTAEKGRKYKSGRTIRGCYWCCKSEQSPPWGKEGKPVTVPVSRSASVVTMHLQATTSTISDAGRASTTSQTR